MEKFYKNSKGFTLVELLVVIATFVVITITAVDLFVLMIAHQRTILAEQELLSQVSYVTEYMSRALRMAEKSADTNCLSQIGKNYEITRFGKGVKFINASNQGACQEFFLDEDAGAIKEIENNETPVPLTSESLIIDKFNIKLYGDNAGDEAQPRIIIAMDIGRQTKNAQVRKQVQLTISQRNLDEL